jgi:hypothetical protein
MDWTQPQKVVAVLGLKLLGWSCLHVQLKCNAAECFTGEIKTLAIDRIDKFVAACTDVSLQDIIC